MSKPMDLRKYHGFIRWNDMGRKNLTTPFSEALRICRGSRHRIRNKEGFTAVIVYIPTYHTLGVEYWTDEDLKAECAFNPSGYISLFVERLWP